MKSSSISECVHKLTYLGSGDGNIEGAEYCIKCDELLKLPPQSGKSDSGKKLSTSKYILSTANIDSGKEWESILKLGIVDEDEGTITFSYNELVNLLEGK